MRTKNHICGSRPNSERIPGLPANLIKIFGMNCMIPPLDHGFNLSQTLYKSSIEHRDERLLDWAGLDGDGLYDVEGAAFNALEDSAVGDLLNAGPDPELEAGQGLAEAERGRGRAVLRRHGALHNGAGGEQFRAEQQLVPILYGGAARSPQLPFEGAGGEWPEVCPEVNLVQVIVAGLEAPDQLGGLAPHVRHGRGLADLLLLAPDSAEAEDHTLKGSSVHVHYKNIFLRHLQFDRIFFMIKLMKMKNINFTALKVPFIWRVDDQTRTYLNCEHCFLWMHCICIMSPQYTYRI